MTDPPVLPSDRQLADAARTGHDAAWAELMSRHEASIRAVLPKRSKKRNVTRALAALRDNLHDTSSVGEEAVRAFRPRALASYTKGAYGPVALGTADHSEVDPGDDRRLLARAFGRLPEPWQTALWHTHVEQLSAAEVSPLVGRTVNEVGELIATAERGLADAFLQEYIESAPLSPTAASMVAMLGGYVRESLPPHEHRLVEDHLEQLPSPPLGDEGAEFRHTSEDSRRLIAVATALPTALPPAIAPGITGLSVDQLRSALGTTTRSFGTEQMVETQSSRFSRAVLVGSAAAVAVALLGVAVLVRQTNDSPDGATASTTTASPSTSLGTSPTTEPGDRTEPTTTLDLRPSGPPNEVVLVVTPGARAAQLDAGDTALTTGVSSAAPVFAGGTGTLDISMRNAGNEPVAANLEMMLPRGVVFDRLVDGDATCSDPDDDSPFCDIVVEPDASVDLSVQLSLEAIVVGRLVVDGDTLDEPFEAQIVAVPDLVHNSVGHGDVLVIGNTVMSCGVEASAEVGIACDEVRAGVGDIVDRWDVPLEFIGADATAGLTNSSRATLALPETAEVAEAYLFWSGDLEEGGRTAPSEGQSTATLVTPAGDVVDVEAEEVVFGQEDSTQYVGSADVTDLVAAGGAGDYLVGNVASVEADGSYGAWSLVVVTDDDALPRRQRVVLEPFAWVAPQDPYNYRVGLPTPVLAGAHAQLAVVAFEGERGFTPESLVVGGTSIGGDNPFDSTITGERAPAFDNNLGVDIDAYALSIDTPAGTLAIDATSDDDGIRLAILGITIDIES